MRVTRRHLHSSVDLLLQHRSLKIVAVLTPHAQRLKPARSPLFTPFGARRGYVSSVANSGGRTTPARPQCKCTSWKSCSPCFPKKMCNLNRHQPHQYLTRRTSALCPVRLKMARQTQGCCSCMPGCKAMRFCCWSTLAAPHHSWTAPWRPNSPEQSRYRGHVVCAWPMVPQLPAPLF